MCYLKNLELNERFDIDNLFCKGSDASSEQAPESTNVLIPCLQKKLGVEWSDDQKKLVALFQLIERNNHNITTLSKILTENSQKINSFSINADTKTEFKASQMETPRVKPGTTQQSHSTGSLKQKLFGVKKYKYSIKSEIDFSTVVYKERNFHIAVNLVDQDGKFVRNCNPINLCLAVSDGDAKWVHENRMGENFLKGKTQVELYKGKAQFCKLYARDISRNFVDGKLNFVIYAKPSTLRFSNSGSFETNIQHDEISPLILENITVKAKKN